MIQLCLLFVDEQVEFLLESAACGGKYWHSESEPQLWSYGPKKQNKELWKSE